MRTNLSPIALTALAFWLTSAAPSAAGPADDVAAASLAKWAEAFAKLDGDGVAALYATDALFYGSSPPLYRGVEGVKAYFKALPPATSAKVEFSDLTVTPVGADIINLAGVASFTINNAPTPRVYRLTQVFVRDGGTWKILSHHVSPKAP